MTRRLIFGRVALSFLVMYVASQTKLAAQPLECPTEGSGALMLASYPAYTDAKQLAQELSANGYIVRCIARSKWEASMPITKGAALYITNRGDFDVIFLPKPQNFDSFEIAERQENGTYIYTFRGNPRLFSAGMEGKKAYFFKQSNRLFLAFDKQTGTNLAEFVSSNPK